MPRSDEAEAWFVAVYEAVQQIPYGHVTTYGHIAKLLGFPERPRQVGVCLKHLPSESEGQDFHNGNVPWQRVINSKGEISHRGPGSAARQAAALRSEGVEVKEQSMNEFYVGFEKGWWPERLPRE